MEGQSDVRIRVGNGEQRPFEVTVVKTVRGRVVREARLRPDGDMRRDDHELAFVLTLLELVSEPVEPGLVETSGAIIRRTSQGVALLVGIVKHNDLERHIRLRLEGIARKVVVEVRLSEAVTDRVRSGCEKLTHPIQA